MKERTASASQRKTTETDIRIRLNLDGHGRYKISTGIRFLDHMLELFARHGGFDLEIEARGDLDVDQHHTVEDLGIVLGQALREALGAKKGINRAGYFLMPMDETLAVAAIDLSGRPYLALNAPVKAEYVGDLQAELLEDFFQGFTTSAAANLHLKLANSRSSHHAVEALVQGFRARVALCLFARHAPEVATSQHQRTAVIALLNYGAGNVGSVLKAIRHLGYPAEVIDQPDQLRAAEKIIFPGQGHFGAMMKALEERQLLEPLRGQLAGGTPYLGICLGLQALYEASDEAPDARGLGLIPGRVTRFEGVFKVPHVGWSQLEIRNGAGLFKGVENGSFVYFCHSYYGPVTRENSAVTGYGQTFAAGIEMENIRGVQFHPEKSGEIGLKVLANFLGPLNKRREGRRDKGPGLRTSYVCKTHHSVPGLQERPGCQRRQFCESAGCR